SWRKSMDDARRLAEEFLAEFGRQMTMWLHDWQPRDQHSAGQTANLGVGQVQFFDALSLWLCCAVRTDPHSVNTLAGQVVRLAPVNLRQIRVSPWPFTVNYL